MSKAGESIVILLIEDNPGDVVLTREALNSTKVRNNILVANDGEIALEMLLQKGVYKNALLPDLVLLDLNLPKIDGKSVLHAVKQSDVLQHIPVIILTSSDAETDIVRSYDLNADSYIVKPVTLEKFCHVIETIDGFCFNVEHV